MSTRIARYLLDAIIFARTAPFAELPGVAFLLRFFDRLRCELDAGDFLAMTLARFLVFFLLIGGGEMDLAGILGNVAGGGVGGGVIMAIVGLIKNAMNKS